MQGDLRDTSLEQLCRMLGERAATGQLSIDHEGESVDVWFRQGRVVRASSSAHQMRLGDRLVHGGLITTDDLRSALAVQRSSGNQLGEVLVTEGLVNRHVVRVFTQEQVLDSLFAAVRWTGGGYKFHEDDVPEASVPSDLTVPQLLFALESRHRHWNEITRTIPGLDAVPEFVPGADPLAAHLEPGEATIVKAIDGHRSLDDLANDLGFGPYEVATVVHGLTVLGLVRLGARVAALAGAGSRESEASVDAVQEATSLLLDRGPGREAPDDDVSLQLADLADLGSSDDVAAAPPPPPPPPAPPVAAPAPPPPADDDDDLDDIAPWAFTIEGEDDEADPEPPRRAQAAPITSGNAPVGDVATGTPLPPLAADEPEPSPAAPANPESADSADQPARPRTGEMSDLLRELRQLSGE